MTEQEIQKRIKAIGQSVQIASRAIEDSMEAASVGVDVSGVWGAAKKIIDRGARELFEIEQKQLSREIAKNVRDMKVTFRR
jgi:hypothetical protein